MPMSSMDWGHCRRPPTLAFGCQRHACIGHVVVMVMPTLEFGWPRRCHAAYAHVWLATSSSSRLWVLGVSRRRGGVVGWVGVRWWIGVGVAEMEGGSQVSGGVETVIKARYET